MINLPKSDRATRIALQKLSAKIFRGLTINGLLYYDDGEIKSLGAATNGQLPIGNTGNAPTLATITGTTNQITVTNGAGSITLSLPQDYNTAATPTLGNLTLSGTETYGLDTSGGTWTADLNLSTDPTIYGGGARIALLDSGSNHNLFIGQDCFKDDDGTLNLGIGESAGENNSTSGGGNNGTTNLFIGYQAGLGDSGGMTGYSNLGIGYLSCANLTSGYDNCAVGTATMRLSTTAYQCMAFGDGALYSCTEGHDNIGVGYNAGYNISTGDNNTLIGSQTGFDLTTSDGNTAIAAGAWINGTGSQNTVLGTSAATTMVAGDDNVIIGSVALYAASAGSRNIIIGRQAGRRQSGTVNDVFLLDNRDRSTAAAELTSALLYGTMSATVADQQLTINGDLKVGNTTTTQSAYFGDGGTTNYSEFETDGTLEFNGNATVWNDANVGAAMFQLPASGALDEDEFVDEGGSDTGIATWAYAIGESSSGSIEIPHDYKEGSDIYFHIHWQGITAPADGTDNVNWQLTYTVGQNDETLDAVTTITKEIAIDVQYDFKFTDFAAITGTNFNIGDQFLFTIERIAASADDYAGDCLVATVGLHYECDTVGSRQITT